MSSPHNRLPRLEGSLEEEMNAPLEGGMEDRETKPFVALTSPHTPLGRLVRTPLIERRIDEGDDAE